MVWGALVCITSVRTTLVRVTLMSIALAGRHLIEDRVGDVQGVTMGQDVMDPKPARAKGESGDIRADSAEISILRGRHAGQLSNESFAGYANKDGKAKFHQFGKMRKGFD